MFLTKLANILNFICQICNFLQPKFACFCDVGVICLHTIKCEFIKK